MDNVEPAPESNVPDKPIDAPTKHRSLLWIVLLVIILGILSAVGVYKMEQSKASKVVRLNNSLTTQMTALTKEIKQQDNVNSGVISPGSVYKDPVGGIGFVNGAVTLTLPNGWKRVSQSDCAGGTIDSTAVCQDVASVTPGNMVNSDGTAKWSATIGVYDYASTGGTAKNWFETVYYHSPLADLGDPSATNISQSPVNGYSALSFDYVSTEPAPTPPDYTDAYFTVVHGSYAVVISAQVQASTAYGNSSAFNYTSTYLPELTKMVQTIKFQ